MLVKGSGMVQVPNHFGETPDIIKELVASTNEAASHVQRVYVLFVLASLYFALIIGSTTHKDLIIEKEIEVPILAVKLDIFWVYLVGAGLYLILHLNLLIQHDLLSQKLHEFESVIKNLEPHIKAEWQHCIYPLIFAQVLIGTEESSLKRFLLRTIIFASLVLAPLMLLLWAQVAFLPHHDGRVIWAYRLALLVDIFLLWYYWPIIHTKSSTWRDWAKMELTHLRNALLLPGVRPRRAYLPTDPEFSEPKKRLDHAMARVLPVTVFLLCAFGSLVIILISFSVAVIPESALDRSPFLEEFRSGSFGVFRNLQLQEEPLFKVEFEQDFGDLLNSEEPDPERVRQLPNALGLDLRGRDLRGASLSGSRLHKINLDDANLQAAVLKEASLLGANLARTKLQGAHLEGTKLQGANLTQAYLSDAFLNNARLQGAVLKQTDLRRATLQGARLNNADLENALLHGASLKDANLEGAKLFKAQLQGANLKNANLRGAKLQSADLAIATLRHANLEKADLSGAMLQGADLRGAQLAGSEITAETDISFSDIRKLDNQESLKIARGYDKARAESDDKAFAKRFVKGFIHPRLCKEPTDSSDTSTEDAAVGIALGLVTRLHKAYNEGDRQFAVLSAKALLDADCFFDLRQIPKEARELLDHLMSIGSANGGGGGGNP